MDLKNRLLEATGAMASSDNGRQREGKTRSGQNGGDSSHGQRRRSGGDVRRAKSLSEQEVMQRLQGSRRGGQGKARLRRRFIRRLAVALRSYGSSATRTEFLIEKAANRLDVEVNIAVFPSLILLSFPDAPEEDSFSLLTVEGDLDVDKLGRADHLANNVGNDNTPLLLAYWRLKAIATSPPKFCQWWWRLFGFSLSASMSALLFFNGGLWDGIMSIILGLIVGIFDLIGAKSTLFATVIEFVTATAVSLVARLFSVYFKKLSLCFFAMVLASLVQLLPGLSLTIGVSEMVAKSHVTGTSRIMYALFSALQLGFGIAVGENLVFWEFSPAAMKCEAPGLPIWWSPLWFAGFSVASNLLLYARLDQWPGMIVTAGAGYLVSTVASLRLGASASSVVAAFAVGVTGTLFSNWRGDLPLVMILSGVLLLVPGGIGVQGVAAMLQEDVLSGMGFVFNMMVVGLSITIGLLLAKLALPAAVFGSGKTTANNKNTIAAQLQDDEDSSSSSSEEKEEDMAI